MRQKSGPEKQPSEDTIKDIRRATRRHLAGDTARAATSDEVKDLRREAQALKEVVGQVYEAMLEPATAKSPGRRRPRSPCEVRAGGRVFARSGLTSL